MDGIATLVIEESKLTNSRPVKCSYQTQNFFTSTFKMDIKNNHIGLPKDGPGLLRIIFQSLSFGSLKREIKKI